MKVLILTEGGKNIGFGHISRMIAICQGFEETGAYVKLLINGDSSIKDIIEGYNYEIINWLSPSINLPKILKEYDITIIDSYLANEKIYEQISQYSKLPVYYDDYNRINYPKGIVVNGNIHAKFLNYPQKEDIIYLLGTEYFPLKKEFWNIPPKKINENITSFIITFGGNDIRNLTPKILKFLNQYYPKTQKNIIIGKGYTNIKEVESVADKNTNLIFFPNTEKMKTVMLLSDIAISAGGQTLYELCRTGTPTIAIAIAHNQINNIKYLKKFNLIKFAGWWYEKKLLESLNIHIEHLTNFKYREIISNKMQSIIKGQSIKNLIDKIIYLWRKFDEYYYCNDTTMEHL